MRDYWREEESGPGGRRGRLGRVAVSGMFQGC